MAAKNYEEWKPSNEQALKLAEAADVFGQMVWDAAVNSVAQNSTSNDTERAEICSICGAKGCGNVFMLQYSYKYCPNCGRKLSPVS